MPARPRGRPAGRSPLRRRAAAAAFTPAARSARASAPGSLPAPGLTPSHARGSRAPSAPSARRAAQPISSERSCTDLLFLLFFIGFWAGMVVIGAYAFANGADARPPATPDQPPLSVAGRAATRFRTRRPATPLTAAPRAA